MDGSDVISVDLKTADFYKGDVIIISYDPTDVVNVDSELEDSNGNVVKAFSYLVTNKSTNAAVDRTPPEITQSQISEDGKSINILFSEDLDPDFLPTGSTFQISLNGQKLNSADIAGVQLNGNAVVITFDDASAIPGDQTVVISYDTSFGILQDDAGNKIANFRQVVNNNSVVAPQDQSCLLYTSPSPRDRQKSRMPSSA